MIIVLKPKTTEDQVKDVVAKVKSLGLKPMISRGLERTIIGVIGDEERLSLQPLEAFEGVEKVMPVLSPYKLVSREFKPADTAVHVGKLRLGGKRIHLMAGPCAVENPEQLKTIADLAKKQGATILRGGAFKPRTSPYSFQGMGVEGLKLLHEVGQKVGLPVVTELMDVRQLEAVEEYADIIQIGARNIQNFDLLKEVGLSKKPVLLKRGMASTVKDLLLSAEYILQNGNFNVILCERGIRTFESETRFTLDVSAIPVIKELSHLPVVVDPSHAAGKRQWVPALAKAAVAAGADGLIVEVHHQPEEALCDGPQALLPDMFKDLVKDLKKLAKAVGREF